MAWHGEDERHMLARKGVLTKNERNQMSAKRAKDDAEKELSILKLMERGNTRKEAEIMIQGYTRTEARELIRHAKGY